MMPFTNKTLTTYRLTQSSGESSYVLNLSGLRVYSQVRQQTVSPSFDGQGAFKEYVMMTTGKPDIIIGDKLTDTAGVSYYVDGVGQFDDLTGKRTELTCKIIYD